MKRNNTLLAVAMVVIILSLLTSAWAIEDVRHTKHNLSLNPNVGATVTGAGEGEVCIFCHTPHGGQSSRSDPNAPYSDAAPLWNRQATGPTSGNYTMYSSPNFDGQNKKDKPQGVSLACLSCHDGTIALDALANYPGSGSNPSSLVVNRNWPRTDASGHMKNDPNLTFPMLGIDLSNDHPISMEIPDTDPQFKDLTFTQDGLLNFIQRASLSDSRLPVDKRDKIRAYPAPNGNSAGKFIECASCHNPHEASRPGDPEYDPTRIDQAAAGITYTDTNNSRFLRFPSFDPTMQVDTVRNALLHGDRNAGSLLCLSCHQK